MDITNPRINEYLLEMLEYRTDLMIEMEEYARRNNITIISPLVGAFISQIAILINAMTVFEIGSGIGYSSYYLAMGMNAAGKIICTDRSEYNKSIALDFLNRGDFGPIVQYHVGDPSEIIREIEEYDEMFDIVFNNAEIEGYSKVLDLVLPLIREGGIFIANNVLHGGKILEAKSDKESRSLLEFNRKLFISKGVFPTILPIGDGLGIAVKPHSI